MTNRRTLNFSIFAAAILALCLPVLTAAQGRYDYPDYGRNGRYDERYLKDTINRLDRLAKEFEKDLDRALDRSRVDGTRREDNINAKGHDFRRAVSNLKSNFGNGRDLNRSRDEAQRVLEEARQFDRIGRGRGGVTTNEVASDWAQIQRELQIISDAYGLGYGYNNGGNYPNRRDDDYRRNNPNNRNRNNNDWWRRIPWPTN